MTDADVLQQIQSLQFADKSAAEKLLKTFIGETFGFQVAAIELRPLAVSLNSFNGFMTLDDRRRLFFKTHTEPDSIIGEYYHAAMLAEAGYPVIQPIFSSEEAGKQFLIYEVIEDPSVFDVAWAIETGQSNQLADLTRAQNAADDLLLQLYRRTLAQQSAGDATCAPIHQLFYHRMTGGRLERFYGALPGKTGADVTIELPDAEYLMSDVRRAYWEINGQHYDLTLDDLIARAIQILNPAQPGLSIIGHGDAHNGNVFFRPRSDSHTLVYFDPAFAGRHHPLLDLAKPLFHNVFAMWMYFPNEKRDQTTISVQYGDVWRVTHDYEVHAVREMFLQSKVERVLIPILREFKALQHGWRDYLKAALFCCPFLTMNLANEKKFSPEISLLGLTMAVEMGAESSGKRSRLDELLDQVADEVD